MPRNDSAPNFALLSHFDASTWAGVNLFNRGAVTVIGSGSPWTSGPIEDAVTFLNGRGSELNNSMETQILAEVVGAQGIGGSWNIELMANDRFRWEVTGAGAAAFSLEVSGEDWMGIGSGTLNSTPIAGGHRLDCPLDWTRGRLTHPSVMFIQGASSFKAPAGTVIQTVQDVIAWNRRTGVTSDADDTLPINNLTYLDNAANDPGAKRIRWGLGDDGHVYTTYPSALPNLVWASTSFRDRLGFTGDLATESSILPGGLVQIRATNPLPGGLFPSRPFESQIYNSEIVNTGKRRLSGGWVGNHTATYTQQTLNFYVDGPADQVDLTQHWLEGFCPYIPQGARVNVYQDWGDCRRSLPSREVNPATPEYDLLHTAELNGMRGRVRSSITSTGPYALQYPSRLRRRSPMTLTVEEL